MDEEAWGGFVLETGEDSGDATLMVAISGVWRVDVIDVGIK